MCYDVAHFKLLGDPTMYEIPLSSVLKVINSKLTLYKQYSVSEYARISGDDRQSFYSYQQFLDYGEANYREPKKWYDFLFKKKLIIYAEATHEHRKLLRIHDIVYVVPK